MDFFPANLKSINRMVLLTECRVFEKHCNIKARSVSIYKRNKEYSWDPKTWNTKKPISSWGLDQGSILSFVISQYSLFDFSYCTKSYVTSNCHSSARGTKNQLHTTCCYPSTGPRNGWEGTEGCTSKGVAIHANPSMLIMFKPFLYWCCLHFT